MTSRPAHVRSSSTMRALQLRRLHHAAVEQHGGRHPAEAAEELGEVARDRRIVRVGQAHLAQAAGAAALRLSRRRATFGKKPSTSSASACVARDLGLDRAADQLRAAAEDRDRHARRRVVAEQLLLRARGTRARARAAASHRAACRASRWTIADEREVHVVAAEQDVIADRDPLERERAAVVARPRSARSRSCRRRRRTRARRRRARDPCATRRRAPRGTRRTRPAAPRAA